MTCWKYDKYLSLDHGWPLCSKGPDCLEDINHPLILHSLQDYGQSNEYSAPTNSRTEKHINENKQIYQLYIFVNLNLYVWILY